MKHFFQVDIDEVDRVREIAMKSALHVGISKEWNTRTDMYVTGLRHEGDKLMKDLKKKGISAHIYCRIDYAG